MIVFLGFIQYSQGFTTMGFRKPKESDGIEIGSEHKIKRSSVNSAPPIPSDNNVLPIDIKLPGGTTMPPMDMDPKSLGKHSGDISNNINP
uniref:Encoded peptide n=1 Tax=Parastrongyloides trichosuri TaxID=131310 RepID=A0A0N4Z423_PARTI